MKTPFLKSTLFLITFFIGHIAMAQFAEKEIDTLTRKGHRAFVKTERKSALKASHKQFIFKGTSVFANLRTDMVFGIPYTDGFLSANLSLENNFGLAEKKNFFTGSFQYFITPRSGIYAQYYGIKRSSEYTTEKDFIFLDKPIPIGIDVTTYFNTQVYSIGYLLTIMRDSRVFFGVYLNIFFMDLETGIYTRDKQIDEAIEFLLPLPNFGLVYSFELRSWLYFNGSVGFFALDLKNTDFGGSIYNLNADLIFKPTHWIGISLSYELFNVNVDGREDVGDTYIPYTVKYKFSGPALGLSFNF